MLKAGTRQSSGFGAELALRIGRRLLVLCVLVSASFSAFAAKSGDPPATVANSVESSPPAANPDVLVQVTADVVDILQDSAPSGSADTTASVRVLPGIPLSLPVIKGAAIRVSLRIATLAHQQEITARNVSMDALLGEHLVSVNPLAMAGARGGTIRGMLEARAVADHSYRIASRVQVVGMDGATVLALLGSRTAASGAKTDASINLSGQGSNIRNLAGTLNGDVRIVVGPGRIATSKVDFGGDTLVRVLETVNPFRRTEKETQLECAVLRFPIHDGIAVIDRGLGVQTDKVNVLATGAVNLRDETLDLALHTRVREGLGVSVQAALADMVRVQGTFANPTVGIDAEGSARAALNISAAVLTAGASLVVANLYNRALASKPCEVALGGAQPSNTNAIQKTLKAPARLIDKVLGK